MLDIPGADLFSDFDPDEVAAIHAQYVSEREADGQARAIRRQSRHQMRRAKAQALRLEQEKRERRAKVTRRVLIGAGAVAVVGGAAGLVTASVLKKRRKLAVNSQGIPYLVRSDDGAWTYGKNSVIDTTNEGAAVLDVFFDYACPHCAEFDALHADEISTLLDDGKITLVLHPCKILNQDWTDLVMNAVGLVMDKDSDKVLAYHNAVFEEFVSMVQARDGSRQTVATLVSVAEKTGVDGDVTAQLKNTITDRVYAKWTDLGTSAFTDKGLKGTPTIMLDGETVDLSKLSSADSLTKLIGG